MERVSGPGREGNQEDKITRESVNRDEKERRKLKMFKSASGNKEEKETRSKTIRGRVQTVDQEEKERRKIKKIQSERKEQEEEERRKAK